MYQETLLQRSSTASFVEELNAKGVLAGIKVDTVSVVSDCAEHAPQSSLHQPCAEAARRVWHPWMAAQGRHIPQALTPCESAASNFTGKLLSQLWTYNGA